MSDPRTAGEEQTPVSVPRTNSSEKSRRSVREHAVMLTVAGERERANLARKIHDDLAQKLTLAMMELAMWSTEVKGDASLPAEQVRQKIGHLNAILDSAVVAARGVTTSLRPRTLDSFGLVPSLEALVSAFKSRTNSICRLQVGAEPISLSPDVAIQILRVTEAILTQPAAAQWSYVAIKLRVHNGGLQFVLSVTGSGAELPPEAAARIAIFGGKVRNGRGRLTMWFPPEAT